MAIPTKGKNTDFEPLLFSNEHETALLGILIQTPELLSRVTVDGSDFKINSNKNIFNALLSIKERGGNIDILNIVDVLVNESSYSEHVAMEYISNCCEASLLGTLETVESKVLELSNKRKLRRVLKSAICDINSGGNLDKINQNIKSVEQKDRACGFNLQDMVEAIAEKTDEIANGVKYVIPTKIKELDDAIGGGIGLTELFLVGARTSVGKSAFSIQILKNSLDTYNVLYISTEMDIRKISERIIAQSSNIKNRDLKAKAYKDEKNAPLNVLTKFADCSKNQFFGYKTSSFEDIEKAIFFHCHTNDVKIVCIDYIQMLLIKNAPVRYDPACISGIMDRLKDIADELDIAIIVVAQLNNNNEFFGSSAMLQTSSIAIKISANVDEDNNILRAERDRYIELEKVRDGDTAGMVIDMDFDGDSQLYKYKYAK